MKITITGTPGCGKTTVAKLLSELTGIPVFHLSNLIREKGFYTDYDEERDAYVTDVEKLTEFFKGKEKFIAEGLVAHYIPSDLCIILRVNPSELSKRLAGRGYSPSKISENVEAERLAVIATEVFENPCAPRIAHIDTTNRTPEEVVQLILRCMRGEEIFDNVDWLEEQENSHQSTEHL